MDIQFTQPTTRCRMWSWKSEDTMFPVLIILELFRILLCHVFIVLHPYLTDVGLAFTKVLLAHLTSWLLSRRIHIQIQ